MSWPTRVWAVAEVLTAGNMIAFLSDPMDEIDALLDLSTPTVHVDGGVLLGGGAGGPFTTMSVLADGEIVIGDGAAAPIPLAAFTASNGFLKHEQGGLEFSAAAIAAGGLIVGTGTGTMGLLAIGNALESVRVNAGATALEFAAPSDTDAIHDNVDGEISGLTEKTAPLPADHLIIESDADSDAKRRVTIANLNNMFDHDTLDNVSADDHHAQAHTVVSHSDTTGTGTELNTLTDGSNADSLHTHSGFAKIAVGQYTGDGAESKTISGLGFTPKFVQIITRYTGSTQLLVDAGIHWTTGDFVTSNASGHALAVMYSSGNDWIRDNTIIAMASGSFTVDDDAADDHPNKNNQVYSYVAIGD